MAEIRRETQQHSGMHLSDILFALFKRKWTVILCAAGGHHRSGGVLFLLSACVRVTGQVAGALCSGKKRRRPDRGRESRGRVEHLHAIESSTLKSRF